MESSFLWHVASSRAARYFPSRGRVYSAITENYNGGRATSSKTTSKSLTPGEDHSFIEERGELGVTNSKAIGVNWELEVRSLLNG